MDSEPLTVLGSPISQEGAAFDLVVAVAEAVGEATDQRPLSMNDPLFETVDLELLYGVLASMQRGDPVDGSVRFETAEVTVVVDTDGTVIARTDDTTAHRQFSVPPTDASPTGTDSHDA